MDTTTADAGMVTLWWQKHRWMLGSSQAHPTQQLPVIGRKEAPAVGNRLL